MGSLTASGTPLIQREIYQRFTHRGNRLVKSNTYTDVETVVSNSGFATLAANLAEVSGVSFEPGYRGSLSGIPLPNRDLNLNSLATGIVALERLKFIDSSGNFEYKITRAMGIHTSVSRQIAEGSQEAFRTISEKKKFFLDSDRGKTSGFENWNIFTAAGLPVVSTSGVTDTDGSPTATFDA